MPRVMDPGRVPLTEAATWRVPGVSSAIASGGEGGRLSVVSGGMEPVDLMGWKLTIIRNDQASVNSVDLTRVQDERSPTWRPCPAGKVLVITTKVHEPIATLPLATEPLAVRAKSPTLPTNVPVASVTGLFARPKIAPSAKTKVVCCNWLAWLAQARAHCGSAPPRHWSDRTRQSSPHGILRFPG